MASTVGRNDPCPCGSGKKYKLCHYTRDREQSATAAAAATTAGSGQLSGLPDGATPTWKLFLIGSALIVVIGIGLWLVDLPRVGGVVSGVSMLLLILWAAFRNPPPPRADPGQGDAIGFGN